MTIEEAIAAKSFYSEKSIVDGDVESGFAQSDHILEGEVHMGGQVRDLLRHEHIPICRRSTSTWRRRAASACRRTSMVRCTSSPPPSRSTTRNTASPTCLACPSTASSARSSGSAAASAARSPGSSVAPHLHASHCILQLDGGGGVHGGGGAQAQASGPLRSDPPGGHAEHGRPQSVPRPIQGAASPPSIHPAP